MSDQLALAIAARDEALLQVEARSVAWRTVAYDALHRYASAHVLVTSEDIWTALEELNIPPPVEGRAMGPVMQKAVRAGILEVVGYQTGTNPKHHGDIQRMYRSLIVG